MIVIVNINTKQFQTDISSGRNIDFACISEVQIIWTKDNKPGLKGVHRVKGTHFIGIARKDHYFDAERKFGVVQNSQRQLETAQKAKETKLKAK